jgi:hypothetical protein
MMGVKDNECTPKYRTFVRKVNDNFTGHRIPPISRNPKV